jgi:hypothetical protein
MKRKILFFLMIIGLQTANMAQITITSNDMPSAGDTIRTSVSMNTQNIDFAQTGAAFYWDYSQLVPFSQRIDTFITVKQTPVLFWPFFLGSANLVLKLSDFAAFPELPSGNGFQFFTNTSSLFSDVGFGLQVEGVPLPLKYDTPDVLYRFPLNYGDTDEGSTGLEFGLPDVGYLYIERERITQVDGWGTLQTPYGSFETLRLKSVVAEYDSIYVDSLGMGFPIYRNYIEYKWMGNDHALPLLTVVDDDVFGLTIIYQDSIREISVDMPEVITAKNESSYVFPNPAVDYINVFLADFEHGKVEIRLFDLTGGLKLAEDLLVSALSSTWHQIKIDRSIVVPGIYLLQIRQNGRKATNKIIIKQ